YPMLIGAIVSVIGNILLVPSYGVVGASIVLVVVEFLVLFFRVFFIRKEIKISYFIDKNIVIFLFISVVLTSVGYFLFPQLVTSSFINMAIKSIVIFIAYLPCIYFLFPGIKHEIRKF